MKRTYYQYNVFMKKLIDKGLFTTVTFQVDYKSESTCVCKLFRKLRVIPGSSIKFTCPKHGDVEYWMPVYKKAVKP